MSRPASISLVRIGPESRPLVDAFINLSPKNPHRHRFFIHSTFCCPLKAVFVHFFHFRIIDNPSPRLV